MIFYLNSICGVKIVVDCFKSWNRFELYFNYVFIRKLGRKEDKQVALLMKISTAPH